LKNEKKKGIAPRAKNKSAQVSFGIKRYRIAG
jgi:hypothetical protein